MRSVISLRVLYLVTNLIGPPGGIARYSRLVCEAALQESIEITVLSLLDTECRQNSNLTNGSIRYVAFGGNRRRFVQHAIMLATSQSFDMVLVGHPNFAPLGQAAAYIAKTPYATFIYGIEVWKRMPYMQRYALCRSKRVFAISHFTATRATTANDLEPNRLRILHNCLDPEFAQFLSRPRSDTSLSLLSVGRLSLAERYKGHDIVISALPKLLQMFPNLRYDIIGGGDWKPDLETLAESLHVRHAVCFHGQVSETTLREHYASATVFAMPSTGEGFGFVFLEAMMHGLPVVAGNVDATPEVVINGVTGLTVEPRCVTAVSDAISRLLVDPQLCHQMGEAGRRRVTEHFQFDKFKHRLCELLWETYQ